MSTSVSCVALYDELRKLINERSGSEFAVYNNEIDCEKDPLMRLVLPYTTGTWHELSVTNGENLATLLAYAFLGRFVTAPTDNEARDGSIHLEIDYGDGSLQPRRISCEYQKVLYETVIVGVVALLLVMAALNAFREVRAADPEATSLQTGESPTSELVQSALTQNTQNASSFMYPTEDGCVEWSFRRPDSALRGRVARP